MNFDIDPQTVEDILNRVEQAQNVPTLDVIRVAELGKNGRITTIARMIGNLPPELRKHHGARINQILKTVDGAISAKRETLKSLGIDARLASEPIDVTLPLRDAPAETGRIHPL